MRRALPTKDSLRLPRCHSFQNSGILISLAKPNACHHLAAESSRRRFSDGSVNLRWRVRCMAVLEIGSTVRTKKWARYTGWHAWRRRHVYDLFTHCWMLKPIQLVLPDQTFNLALITPYSDHFADSVLPYLNSLYNPVNSKEYNPREFSP